MILTWLIASVWLVNGLFCKALDLVPRHRAIVARILGAGHSKGRTIAIGCLETAMAAWIVSGIAPAVNAWTQIALVLCMNIVEFLLAPDLTFAAPKRSVTGVDSTMFDVGHFRGPLGIYRPRHGTDIGTKTQRFLPVLWLGFLPDRIPRLYTLHE
jgi:hypothetical protein